MTRSRNARFVSLSDLHNGVAYLNLITPDGAPISVPMGIEQIQFINSRTAHVIIKDEEKREAEIQKRIAERA